MSVYWRDAGGVRRSVGAVKFRVANGTDPADLKTIDQIRIRTADGLKTIYQQGIRVAVDPTSAGQTTTDKSGPMTSNSVVVSVAGGTPPYSHSWAIDNGITATNASSAVTAFVAYLPPFDGVLTGTAVDTVTDANGVVGYAIVDLYFQRFS